MDVAVGKHSIIRQCARGREMGLCRSRRRPARRDCRV